MTSFDDNAQFVEAARQQGLLPEDLAGEVLAASGADDPASTVVLQRGIMDIRQVDMIRTLVNGHDVIPGYTILSIIGHGGMGVVFRARQEALKREVALKTILVGQRVNDAIRRFRKEVRSIASLNHPNIVTAFDSGEHEGRIYLAMELVEGQNLTDYVRSQGRLTVLEALAFTRQAAVGLAHAWEHGVVHRDIKPDNLLLTEPSDFDRSRTVKIADLGLAQLNTETDETRITQAGAAVGTPLYMAPEQLSGGTVDCRSDIYGLGSTLYFMLSGNPPFTGDSVASVLYNKAAGRSVPLSKIADVYDDVEQLVASMMATSAAERPADYQAVVSEIDRIAGSTGRRTPSTAAEKSDPAARTLIGEPAPVVVEPSAARPFAAESHSGSRFRLGLLSGLVVLIAAAGIRYALLNGSSATLPAVEIPMEHIWQEPLFNGSSLDDWDGRTPGVIWEIASDPVEQAIAMAGTAKNDASGTTRRRIPVHGESPFFEVTLATLQDSAKSSGIQFGMTDSSGGYLLKVTDSGAALLRDSTQEVIDRITWPPSADPKSHHLRVRLQPTGWFVQVDNDSALAVPGDQGMLREVRLFVEGGRAFFMDIAATGLAVPETSAAPK